MSTIHYGHRRVICFLCGIIGLWTARAQATVLPPDPDNAALLYYQAWFVRPEPDTATYTSLLHVTLGATPDEQVRLYMHGCRDTIRLTDAATKIPQCNWGIMYSHGDNLRPIVAQLEQLILLLEVDAWIFAADNDYRSGLDRCLSIRRFAGHLADETLYGYGVSLRTHETAFDYIQHFLGAVASDSETLLWLQARISEAQGPPSSSGKQVEFTMEQSLQFVRTDPELISMWRDSVSFMTPEEAMRQELLSLTDEEVLERAG
jgi:hypothetical protein